jgi:hypothetical protein
MAEGLVPSSLSIFLGLLGNMKSHKTCIVIGEDVAKVFLAWIIDARI